MPKKVALLFTLLTLIASLLSYKLGSAPVAFAKGRTTQQNVSEPAFPPTLPAAPATWSVFGAIGGSVVVTEPAGGAGVQHVATCISITFTALPASTSALGTTFTLRDGVNGTVLLEWWLEALPGTTNGVHLCGLNVVGTANTAMTIQDSNTGSNYLATVNLIGYDAQ